MNLSDDDVKLFYKLDWGLLWYANQKYGVIKGIDKPDFRDKNLNDIGNLKNKIYANPQIIDSFTSENPLGFSEDELSIVKSWKNFVKGDFFVYKHDKDYSVFLTSDDKPKAYGVLGLMEPLMLMIPYTPLLIETVLLPFKGRIIYHGVFNANNIFFGGGIRSSLKEAYAKTKAAYGVITSLDAPATESATKDLDLIRFYVQNWNDMENRRELVMLLEKRPELNSAYNLEVGKKCSRTYRKNLKQSGVRPCWLAVFVDTIIASGETEKEALEQAKKLVPDKEAAGIYVFRHEGKK